MLLFNHLPVIINLFIHPEEVTTTDRGEKDFSILTVLNTTRMKQVHLISKTIFCFAGLWFNKKKFCFHWITKSWFDQPPQRLFYMVSGICQVLIQHVFHLQCFHFPWLVRIVRLRVVYAPPEAFTTLVP